MRLRSSLFVVSLALGASRAFAADPTPTELQGARDLFGKAVADEDAGLWKEALDKMKRAGSVKMTPGIRFHIALAEEHIGGQLVAALADYTAADQAARAENSKEVVDLVAEPLKSLRARIPTLTITAPEGIGTEVVLDGKALPSGLIGIAVPVEPGQPHTVEARAPGKLPFSTQITLREKEGKSVDVHFVDAPKGTEVTDPKPPPGTAPKPPPHDAPLTPEPSSGRSYATPIALTALTVGTLAFGFVSFFVAGGKADDLRATCPTVPTAPCDDLRPPVRTWDALALGGFIAAGALAIVSVVLWAQPGETAPAKVAIVSSVNGVFLRGSFR
ncbi:hypothetical protein BH09MYX1_BH09MYX1_54390 [soil metagenome]